MSTGNSNHELASKGRAAWPGSRQAALVSGRTPVRTQPLVVTVGAICAQDACLRKADAAAGNAMAPPAGPNG